MVKRPSLLQVWSAVLALFELPTIVTLMQGTSNVVAATPWFDDKNYYRKNPTIGLLYSTVLLIIVVDRLLVAYLPRMKLLVLYTAVIHFLEMIFFATLMSVREEPPQGICYVYMVVIVFNACLYTFSFLTLRAEQKAVVVAADHSRTRQLREIREMRARYAREQQQSVQVENSA